MNRQYSLYSKNKTALKNNLIALLDQTYPGVNALFDSPVREDGSQKWVDFAASFWHVDCVRSLSEKAFTERYRKWCKGHRYNFNTAKAAEIHALAKELIAMLPKDPCTRLLVREAVAQLNAVSKTVEIFRSEMRRLARQLPEFPAVMSLYGVGDSIGPQLMAEIGDVRRFSHKGALTAFAGVDPMPNESGDYEAKSTSSSKRGSPDLRKTLFVLMAILLQKAPSEDPVFQFLDRKRSEGKPYHVYMTAGCNKFLRIYFGRIREYLNSLDSAE